MNIKLVIILSLLSATSFADCKDLFYKSLPPTYSYNQLTEKTYSLCYREFAVLYSSKTKNPVYSAEHLTSEKVKGSKLIGRVDDFHEELAIDVKDRVRDNTYYRTGYDRGHMTPAGDMSNRLAQNESFSLANMAPQTPTLNRGSWKRLENYTRSLASKHREIYVITGPVFDGIPSYIRKRVQIPSGFYKIVTIPSNQKTTVYYADNNSSGKVSVVNLSQIETLTNLQFLSIQKETQ